MSGNSLHDRLKRAPNTLGVYNGKMKTPDPPCRGAPFRVTINAFGKGSSMALPEDDLSLNKHKPYAICTHCDLRECTPDCNFHAYQKYKSEKAAKAKEHASSAGEAYSGKQRFEGVMFPIKEGGPMSADILYNQLMKEALFGAQMFGSVVVKHVYRKDAPAGSGLHDLIRTVPADSSHRHTFTPLPNGREQDLPPATSHDWGAFYDGTANPSLCAGWGEHVPSREHKHRSRRPKRRQW